MNKLLFTIILALTLSSLPNSAYAGTTIDVDDFNRATELGNAALRNKNFDSAFIYLEKASKLGNKDSQFKLALLYMEGLGVKQDYTQAYLWLNVASEVNHAKWRNVRDHISAGLSQEQVLTLAPMVNEYIEKYGATAQNISCARRSEIGSHKKEMQCTKQLTLIIKR